MAHVELSRAAKWLRNACLAAAVFAGLARAQSFHDVQACVERGDFTAAREAAEGLADPLERARALVWVDYGARDWVGALREARLGSDRFPHDAWLAERAAAAALSLQIGRAHV
jgi:hypothetical protein